MTTTLSDRRAVIEGEIETLLVQQGAALLDGKEFDAAAIKTRKGELAAIDAAQAETHRRERQATADSIAQDRQYARSEVVEELKRYQDALKRVEGHAKGLVADLLILQSAATALQSLAGRLGFPGVGFTLHGKGTAKAVSRLLASELQKVGGIAYYGDMTWPSVPPKPDWSAQGRIVATAFAPLVEGHLA